MNKNKGRNKFYAVLRGVSTGLVITMISVAACAGMIHTEMVSEKSCGYCVVATLLISSFAGVWFAVRAAKDNNLVVCMITGSGYYAGLFIISALFYGGRFAGITQTGLLVIAGSICVFLCGFRGKRKPKGRKRLRYSG